MLANERFDEFKRAVHAWASGESTAEATLALALQVATGAADTAYFALPVVWQGVFGNQQLYGLDPAQQTLVPIASSPNPQELEKQWKDCMDAFLEAQDWEALLAITQTKGAGLALPSNPAVAFSSLVQVWMVVYRALAAGDGQRLLFVGADVSGIQSFLYNIQTKGATKALKGRSMYLKLLPEALLRRLNQDVYGTPDGLSVYCSGGGFYTLLPDTEAVRQLIDKLQTEAENRAWDEFHGTVYPSLAFVETMAPTWREAGAAGTMWGKLTKALGQQKNRRWNRLALANFDTLFTPYIIQSQADIDPNTGHPVRSQLIADDEADAGEGAQITRDEERLRNLAPQLRLAKSMRVTFEPNMPSEKLEDHQVAPLGLGVVFSFEKEVPRGPLSYGLRLGSAQAPTWLSAGLEVPESQKDQQRPRTFEEMVSFTQTKEKSHDLRLKRLGVLRMDVDNLGQIFQDRGKAKHWSLAAASSLSYALDYFFRGKLDQIWKQDPLASQCTQILYAGGDDLFILGRWDAVLGLAGRIRDAFAAWTGPSSTVTLSGGMAIVSDNYPLARAAEEAAEAEHLAKHHKYQGQALKNAFAVLGQAFHWTHEWKHLDALRQELAKLYDNPDDRVPEGLLQRLYQHADRARGAALAYDAQTRSQDTLARYRWRWQLAYDLSRLHDRLPKDATDARTLVHQLRQAAMYDPPIASWQSATQAPVTQTKPQADPHKPFIHYAGTAARLVALQRRKND